MHFNKAKMSDSEKKAKLAALKEAHGMASDAMKEGLNGAKKVTVSADSKAGLKKGLDLAEKLVDRGPAALGEQREGDSMDEEMEDQEEGFDEQQEESEPMDEDELEAEIQRLLELKAKLSKD